ncbi:MAG: citrate synthase [Oscillospiraceae bacterium]|nr:citrate synthase [Oscillospiraceae bacterium]
MELSNDVLKGYVSELCGDIRSAYTIDSDQYKNHAIKRGLRNEDGTGVMAGVTRIGSVQGYYMQDGGRVPIPGKLYYRGIDVEDIIAEHSTSGTFGFEEVAYLLLIGRLPNLKQFEQFDAILSRARLLPPNFTEDMILKAPSKNIMNKLARSVLALYSYDENPDDISIENLVRQSIELIGRFPVVVANAYAVKRHHFEGKSLYLHVPRENLSVSENFLRMLRKDKSYTSEEAHLLDLMLILHAEHGAGNNSSFACRVLSSSGTDTYSAISAAVNSLKGPLHGGANSKVMEMFRNITENVHDYQDDDELTAYLGKIMDGTAGDGSKKIYGLGHAVYTISDPRAELIKKYAAEVADKKGFGEQFRLMESIERLGIPIIMERKKLAVPICSNVDLYSGLVYKMLGIPEDLYTPLFAIARIAGWCSHRIEEVMTCSKIIRPAYRAAFEQVTYIPIEQRAQEENAEVD